MALTGITYRPPYAPLVSATITPIAGTGWAAGTWDFCIVVTDVSPQYAYTRESPPLYCNGIVLNGSQGIQLNIVWDASHTTSEYACVWGRRNSGVWTYILVASGNYAGLRNPNTTRDFTTYYQYGNFLCNALSNYGGSTFPVNNQKGTGVIDFGDTGTDTTYTLKQIFDDMYDSGLLSNDYTFYNKYNLFIGCWVLKAGAAAVGKLNMTGFYLWLYSIYFGTNNYRPFTIPTSYGTEIKAYKYGGATRIITLYNTELYATVIDGGAYNMHTASTGYIQVQFNSTSRLYNCRLHATYIRLDAPNNFNDCIGIGTYLMCIGNINSYTPPFTMYGYCQFYSLIYEIMLRDMKFYVPQTYSRYLSVRLTEDNPNEHKEHFLDCLFIEYVSSTDFTEIQRNDYPLKIEWVAIAAGRYQMCYVEHSVNLTIKSGAGIIEDAELSIYDKDNILVASGISDSSGIISEIILITKKIQYIPGSTTQTTVTGTEGTYHTVDRRYPFTFIYEKAGYNTISIVYSTLEDKIQGDVVMQQTTPTITAVAITDCSAPGASDGQIQVTAESYYTLEYSLDNVTYQASNIFENLLSGNYTFYIKDSNDFIVTQNININEPLYENIPYIDSLSITHCSLPDISDGSITVTGNGGVFPYTYSLDNITYTTTNIFENLNLGEYTVYIKDSANNTSNISGIAIIGLAEVFPKITSIITSNCTSWDGNEGSILITVSGDSPFTYSIGGEFQTDNKFENVYPGTYDITVKDINNKEITLKNIRISKPFREYTRTVPIVRTFNKLFNN